MERHGLLMQIKPGFAAEYKKRHDEIWPELFSELKRVGVYDYSIYLDESTNVLFACLKHHDDNVADTIPTLPIMRKWWDYMSDIMVTNPDNSPMATPIPEVFHMD